MKSHHPSPTADEQASLWAARLDGSTLTETDRAELEAWLAADVAHRVLLSSYCQFSADLEQRLPLLAGIKDELAEAKTATQPVRPLPWSRRPLWAGVMLAAAAAVAVILWQGRPQKHFHSIATSLAQRQELTLEDGSHLQLNARTSLAVEYSPTERRVRLAGGEAFFQVAHDTARPFYVETPAGSVRVTGTQFNVRSESTASLEVTVVEGSVQVRPSAAPAPRALTVGDRLVQAGDQVAVSTLGPAALDDALAWRRGQIVFAGTPLREALERFAHYHGRALTASDAAARKRVGGRYSLDDLDGFLAAIEETLDVRVNRGLDGSVTIDPTPSR
jgi:transmembrane sensor